MNRLRALLIAGSGALIWIRWQRIWDLLQAGDFSDRMAALAALAAPLVFALGRLPDRWKRARLDASAWVVLAILAAALLAPVLAPYDPTAQLDLANRRLLPPSPAHPLGTDLFSRDLLSRLLYGARLSLWIACFSVAIAVVVGTGVGLAAGYLGGTADALIMRLVDTALAIPRIFLLLVVLTLWEQGGIMTMVLVLGLTSWFGTSRLVRAEVLSLKQRDFVTAARALGIAPIAILLKHILPNALAPVIVTATLGVGQIVLTEAALSYLGVGVPPPHPSWGSMIADAQPFLPTHPWMAIVPGLALAGTVVAFSFFGESLQAKLDPRRR
ncbi:MAG: peptide ABC transporter permease [Gemmatimonadales bacterium]|nr:Glutathione transport system permease protein GsiD [bacterium HR33]GIW51786.1 MAG: peptide ABC transporter permease [Gemmatimonadales bacterium]